jgi:hypothetical protein
MLLWAGFSQQWGLGHKVDFDGASRRIRIAPGVTQLDVKADLYSSWKEWLQLYDNAKFLPAFRTIGGDPVGGGKYAGDIYFLMNGWQIEIDQNVEIVGTLYHDDGINPYVVNEGGGVTATVSSLAYSQAVEAAVPADAIAAQVRAAIALELGKILELAKIHGLIPGVPVQVSATQRTAGDIAQTITDDGTTVTVSRQ